MQTLQRTKVNFEDAGQITTQPAPSANVELYDEINSPITFTITHPVCYDCGSLMILLDGGKLCPACGRLVFASEGWKINHKKYSAVV
jgi:hypothetical protein